jgi:DNA-binding NarL/FixJ family response regulator
MKKYTPTKKVIRIVIATGDPNLRMDVMDVRELLNSNPPILVIGYARDGIDALIRCGVLLPDLVIMDLKMADCVIGTQMIKAGFPGIIVLIAGVGTEEELQSALRSGADGYLRRWVGAKQLGAIIKKVITGVAVTDEEVYIP